MLILSTRILNGPLESFNSENGNLKQNKCIFYVCFLWGPSQLLCFRGHGLTVGRSLSNRTSPGECWPAIPSCLYLPVHASLKTALFFPPCWVPCNRKNHCWNRRVSKHLPLFTTAKSPMIQSVWSSVGFSWLYPYIFCRISSSTRSAERPRWPPVAADPRTSKGLRRRGLVPSWNKGRHRHVKTQTPALVSDLMSYCYE